MPEGVFGDGRETAVCGSPASRRTEWRNFAGSLEFPPRPATGSSIATRNVAFEGLTDRSRRPYRYAHLLVGRRGRSSHSVELGGHNTAHSREVGVGIPFWR